MAKIQTLQMTALQTLVAGLSRDKGARHQFVVNQTAQIVALALCTQPPKGVGDPADHAKLASTFRAAKLERYALHCAAIKAALSGAMRSVSEWEQAQQDAVTLVELAFGALAPKVRTKAEKTKAEEAKAAKVEAAKVEAAKAVQAAKDMHAAELADAFAKGEASGKAAPAMLDAQGVIDAIRAGAFTPDDVAAIHRASAPVVDVVDVTARPPLALAA